MLKLSNYKQDNFDTRQGLKETIKDFLNEVDSKMRDGYTLDFQELEYKSRDGFIANSHNHGGLDLIHILTDWSQVAEDEEPTECDDYAFRVRVMYESNGVIVIYAGFDFDAPYFRWKNNTELSHEINFRTISGLKRQLKPLIKKLQKLYYKGQK